MSQGKEHIKTKELAALVTRLYRSGAKQEEIAEDLNICVDTLSKHYKKEMSQAILYPNADAADSLYNLMLHAENENVRRAAAEFWLKTRARWKTQEAESLSRENETLKEELKAIREKLDKEHRKDY